LKRARLSRPPPPTPPPPTDAQQIERIKTVEGAAPIAAAIAADAVAHSVPGLNILLQLLAEPVGAAAGVAYMMTLVLSSPAVDPATLAPKGTVLNAEKANDARAVVRVPFTQVSVCVCVRVCVSCRIMCLACACVSAAPLPHPAKLRHALTDTRTRVHTHIFSLSLCCTHTHTHTRTPTPTPTPTHPHLQIIPTALKTVDFSNDASSGAGWTIGESGLPKLPITSVLAVVGVGSLILEAASHAPVLSLFMPRVLSVAGWLAAAGYLLDKREAGSSSSSSSSSGGSKTA
jgi:hypothetical protein